MHPTSNVDSIMAQLDAIPESNCHVQLQPSPVESQIEQFTPTQPAGEPAPSGLAKSTEPSPTPSSAFFTLAKASQLQSVFRSDAAKELTLATGTGFEGIHMGHGAHFSVGGAKKCLEYCKRSLAASSLAPTSLSNLQTRSLQAKASL